MCTAFVPPCLSSSSECILLEEVRALLKGHQVYDAFHTRVPPDSIDMHRKLLPDLTRLCLTRRKMNDAFSLLSWHRSSSLIRAFFPYEVCDTCARAPMP